MSYIYKCTKISEPTPTWDFYVPPSPPHTYTRKKGGKMNPKRKRKLSPLLKFCRATRAHAGNPDAMKTKQNNNNRIKNFQGLCVWCNVSSCTHQVIRGHVTRPKSLPRNGEIFLLNQSKIVFFSKKEM